MNKFLLSIFVALFSITANAFDDNFTGLGVTANSAQMKALGKHSCKGSFTTPTVTVYLTTTLNTDGAGKYTSGNFTETFLVQGSVNNGSAFTCNYVLDTTKTSKYITGSDGRGFAFHYWKPVNNLAQNPGMNAVPGLCSVPLRQQIVATSSYTGTSTITLKNIKATHFIDADFNFANNPQAAPVDIYCD